MTTKRKPKYVPVVDAAGNYTIDKLVAEATQRPPAKDARTRKLGAALQKPPEPPPEEEKPVRVHRRSQLREQEPLWGGKRKPDPVPRDANT